MSGDSQDPLASWPQAYKDELIANEFNPCVGHFLLSETDRVRVWSLSLQPGERVGFHRHVLDYFWTVLNDGKALSHYNDGRIVEATYKAGDTKHMSYGKGEFMIHDLHNIGDNVLSFTTVEFLDSANAPLPVPDHVRRG